MSKINILTINPGSTSTKIAVFQSSDQVFQKNIKHPAEEIEKYLHISDQYEYRKNIIVRELEEANIPLSSINIIIGRGGLVKPIPSGIYEVNETLKADLKKGVLGQHASNLGGLIADDLAKMIPGVKAYIADPVVVDEMEDVARVSGHPEFTRVSIFHALNQKAIGRMHAHDISRKYEDLNLVIAHLGGGISVGAHKKGKVVDVNQALDGDGPFSPERSGTLPSGDLVRACFSGKYTKEQLLKMITGKGGYVAYLGTNSAYEVEQKVLAGDEKAKFYQKAMAHQIAKEIGAMAAVLDCNVDAILITGGMAYDKDFINLIKDKIGKIAPVNVYPGEDEMRALAMNGLLLMNKEIVSTEYK